MKFNKDKIKAICMWTPFGKTDFFEEIFQKYNVNPYLRIFIRIILIPIYVIYFCINSNTFWKCVEVIGLYVIPIVCPLIIYYLHYNTSDIIYAILLLILCFFFTRKLHARVLIGTSISLCSLMIIM